MHNGNALGLLTGMVQLRLLRPDRRGCQSLRRKGRNSPLLGAALASAHDPLSCQSGQLSLGENEHRQLSTRKGTDPVFPPADAEMVRLPSRIPVTRPVLLTVARLVLELTQVKVTPLIT